VQRVLLTGSTGFVGHHLASALLNQGLEVHLLIRPNSNRARIQSLPGAPVIHVHDGTIRRMVRIVQQAAPDTVFHLASHIVAEHQGEDIEPLIASNILLGTQLLEAATRVATPYFVNTGTFFQHYEGRSYSPVSLYAATKQAFQDVLQYYVETTPVAAITLTLFDTYGPDDSRPKLLNLLLRAAKDGRPLLLSPGEQEVDLVFISDVVQAFFRAANILVTSGKEISGRSFSVDTGHRLPLREVVRIFECVTGYHLRIQWGARPYRPREVMTPWKGETLPGWKPTVDLERGIRLTISSQGVEVGAGGGS